MDRRHKAGRGKKPFLRMAALVLFALVLLLGAGRAEAEDKAPAETKRPRIGIAWTGGEDGELTDAVKRGIEEAGAEWIVLPQAGPAAGIVFGRTPETLWTCGPEASNAGSVLDGVDAVVVAGTAHLSSALAFPGSGRDGENAGITARDVSDFLLMRCCLAKDLPVLGIGRGMEALAVCTGAQTEEVFPLQGVERPEEGEETEVSFVPGSLAAAICGGDSLMSFSGTGFRIDAGSLAGRNLAASGVCSGGDARTACVVERTDKTFAVGADPGILTCAEEKGECFLQRLADTARGENTWREARLPKRILVIETTDIHGYFIDASAGDPALFQYRMALLSKRIEEERASGKYDDVLLLDGGDIYQGTPVSNEMKGEAMRACLDVMGYDAVALGNHEFDWDVERYCADPEGTVPAWSVGELSGDPDIPVLASNLFYADSGERVPFTKDYAVIEKAGLRIAVIGYLPDYRDSILAEKIAPYVIDEDLGRLQELVQKVREEEEPDAMIVLAHGKPKPVAKALSAEEVCLVAGGHSHSRAAKVPQGQTAYIQGNCYAQGYAWAVLEFPPDGCARTVEAGYTDLMEEKERMTDTAENREALDGTVLALSHEDWEMAEPGMGEVLGWIDTPVVRRYAGNVSTAGNFLTGLMLEACAAYEPVAAFCNSGGIRTEFRIPEGASFREITVYDIYTIAPFANRLLVYELTGEELAKHLENGLKDGDFGDQVSGLSFAYTAEEGTDGETVYRVVSITLDDGRTVDITDSETLYPVCVSTYCATYSGSVFADKEPLYAESQAPVDSEAMIEVLRDMGEENGGQLFVDTGMRGIRVEDAAEEEEPEELAPAA